MSLSEFLESNLFNGFFWSVIVGMVITSFFNYKSKPKLKIKIGIPETGQGNVSRKKFSEIRVEVTNVRNPWFLSWLVERRAAIGCIGNLFFEDNAEHELKSIKARWIDSPLPEERDFLIKQRMDIPSGSTEYLVIARKYEGDDCFYPINNESIMNNPDFKKPEWKIKNSEVVLRVEISTGDKLFSKRFRIVHKTNKIEDFELIDIR